MKDNDAELWVLFFLLKNKTQQEVMLVGKSMKRKKKEKG
jgi:hypothetical protein